MTMNRPKVALPNSKRQRITLIITVIVVAVVLWQVLSLFGIGSGGRAVTTTAEQNANPIAKLPTPTARILDKSTATTEREKALIELQERTQAAYLKALNELQLLKIQRDIASTNREIATARLDTVTAQKKIIDTLSPPAPPPTPAVITRSAETPVNNDGSYSNQPITYSVVSISRIKGQWRAVLSGRNALYNVATGDELQDKTKVVKISDSSVILDKGQDGEVKLTLVPTL